MDKAPHWRTAGDPLTETAKPTLAAVREDLGRVPLARRIATVVSVLLSVCPAPCSCDLPCLVDSARALSDAPASDPSLRQPVAQDKRVVLVPFTPDTQRTTGERSQLDRTTHANAFTSLGKKGAKAI